MKKRIEWLDSLRGLMILFIVYGHAVSDGDLRKYVYSFHVAAFFFISGFLRGLNKEESYIAFIRKKFQTLMIPYYIFSVISILIFVVLGRFASDKLNVAIKTSEILPNFFGMLYANGSTGLMKWNLPLWFIPCLFATELLFYPLARLFLMRNDHKQNLFFASLFGLITVFAFLNYYCLRIGKLPFGLENAVYLMPFYMIGFYLSQKNNQQKTVFPKKVSLTVGFIALAIGGIGMIINSGVDYVSITYGKLWCFYISAFASIIGYTCICYSIPIPILHYIGKNTLPVLLMHKFPVVFLQILLAVFWEEHRIVFSFAITVIATAASLFVGSIIQKIVPFALGKHK